MGVLYKLLRRILPRRWIVWLFPERVLIEVMWTGNLVVSNRVRQGVMVDTTPDQPT